VHFLKSFEHIITRSESNREYKIVDKENNKSQSSYQLGKDLGRYLHDNHALEEISKTSNHSIDYKLKESFKVMLSDNIISLIGEIYHDKPIDIVFTEKSDGKFDIRRLANKKADNNWFVDLFDTAVENDIFKTKVDIESKFIEFDIQTFSDINGINLSGESHQKIYYGAPGTGKSFKLHKDSLKFGKNVRRVTFHSNMLYGDFVGTYKPVPTNNPNVPITYQYVPGPLIKSLIDSLLNPFKNHLLIIEEINRANVSATFGEIFQLLDRNDIGSSTYPIDISEDLNLYLQKMIYENDSISGELKRDISRKLKNGLIFPSNLYLWSTMNSADQGVLPLDTAFKRRWDFEYFPINYSYDENLFESFSLIKVTPSCGIPWNDIRLFINNLLSSLNVPEDKLLGPFFLSKKILESESKVVTESFKNKVLMYLFEDIGMQYRSKIFNVTPMRLSSIREEFDNKGLTIFNGHDVLDTKLKSLENNSSTNYGDKNENDLS